MPFLQLIMRHRQAKTKFAKRCTPVTLDDYSLDNISVFNSFRRKQRGRASRTSKRSYTNTGFEDPVSKLFNFLFTFSFYCSQRHSNFIINHLLTRFRMHRHDH